MIHKFKSSTEGMALPEKFTYPFCYTPHPLCVKASEEVQEYLSSQLQWSEELAAGKMFGVLVISDDRLDIGYITAYSGNLAHSNKHDFFVPPVFDLLDPEGFFIAEENCISRINEEIEGILNDKDYLALKDRLAGEVLLAECKVKEAKHEMKLAKAERDKQRESNPDEKTIAGMIRDSQFAKAELKRLERSTAEQIKSLREQLNVYENKVGILREERRNRSFALQRRLFDSFRVLNANGEEKGLYDIFEESVNKLPPAGAGECAAPKLLQYAYQRNLHPVAIAEFWWEKAPGNNTDPLRNNAAESLRRHGYFYPACKSKCEPILNFMIQGLDVEPNPLLVSRKVAIVDESTGFAENYNLEIIFEDEWIVIVNKPAGMLSVPGKNGLDSVYSLMRQRYPDASGPLIAHRLDMDTSGLMIITKTKEVHKEMQQLFASGSVEKCYIAILDGTINSNSGKISLPICLDPEDRPRQTVDYKHGKPAITRYKVLDQTKGEANILFYPKTGRTHQLRVHSAHPKGLNTPIKGDKLYGQPSDRLYLHAASLKFAHPATGIDIYVEKEADFRKST